MTTKLTLQIAGRTLTFGVPIPAVGSGEANTGVNVGGGAGEVFRDKLGDALNLRTLVGVSPVSVATVGDTVEISGSTIGDVVGPASSTDDALARFDGTTGKLIQDSSATLDDAGNLAVAGTVDGRDLAVDGAKLDGIEAGAKDDQTITAGAGLTGGGVGNVTLDVAFGSTPGTVAAGDDSRLPSAGEKGALAGTSGTPSGTNRYATDADARLTDARAPTTHAATHENGGADEVSVAGLSGLLADAQTPTTHAATHEDGGADELDVADLGSTSATSNGEVATADGLGGVAWATPTIPTHVSTHENGGADELSVAGLSGLLADAQTPTTHVSTHTNGGVDELSVTGLSGLLADGQTPLSHASTHSEGGTDELDVADLGSASAASAGQVPVADGIGGLDWGTAPAPAAHASTHEDGGADELSVAGLSGLLADAQTPTTHASTHQDGGADEVATATAAVDAIPKALASLPILDPAWTAVAEVVTVAKDGSGDFQSVRLAVNSITDATQFKPYVVAVAPGAYTESQITMKEYVSVIGTGVDQAAVIGAANDDEHLVVGNINCAIANLTLNGPADAGFATIYHATESAFGRLFTIRNITLLSGYYAVWATGSTNPASLFMSNVFWQAGAATTQVVRITGTGRCTGIGVYIQYAAPNAMTQAIYVSGASAVGGFSTVDINVLGLTDGLFADDGASVNLSPGRISGATNGIHIGAAGSGTEINAASTFIFSATKSLYVESATASLTFTGQADKTSLDVNASASFIASFVDLTSGEEGLINIGEVWAGTEAESIPLATVARATTSTGFVSGGAVTRDSGLDVDVAAGTGFVRTATGVVFVEWNAANITLPASSTVEVFVTSAGVVSSSATPVSHTDNIKIASALTDATSILSLSDHEVNLVQRAPFLHLYLGSIIGNRVATGTIASEHSAPSLQLAVSGGTWYNRDLFVTTVGAAPITFTAWYRDGSGGWTTVASQTSVDPDNYDDGSGTLASIPSGEFKKDLLYLIDGDDGEEYHLFYAQETYATKSEAEVGNIPTPPDFFVTYGLRIAGPVVEEGETDLASVVDEHLRFDVSGSGAAATTDHNSLANLTLGDAHTQYQLRAEKNSASGYPGLTAGSKLSSGAYQVYGSTASTAVEGNDTRVPTQLENDALAGTSGAPSNSNRYVTDADARNTDARTPTAHASTHEDGGADELSVTGLSGLLADAQTPLAHVSTHEDGGADELDVGGLSGLLADGQTPLAHVSTHADGGADELSVAGLSGLLADAQTPTTHASTHEDGGADELSVAGLSGLLADAQTPTSHAASHADGGTDELDVADLGSTSATASGQSAVADGTGGVAWTVPAPLAHASTHEDGGADELDVGGLSGLLADAQTPLAHASTHADGGTDELDVANLGSTSTTVEGQVAVADGSGGVDWETPTVGDWQTASSEARSTTTSNTPQIKTSLTTPALTGTYLVHWVATIDSNNKENITDLYNLTDATILQETYIKTQDPDFLWPMGGFAVVTFTGSAKTFQVRWYNIPGKSDTLGIQAARIALFKVA